MYLRTTTRNGTLALKTVREAREGDFEIACSPSSQLRHTVYQSDGRTWHSLGLVWQDQWATATEMRRRLLRYLREEDAQNG